MLDSGEMCDLTAAVVCGSGQGCDMRDCTCKQLTCCALSIAVDGCTEKGVLTDVSFDLGEVSLIETITIDISQTWASDLEISLLSPDGVTYVPLLGDGGSDDLGNGAGDLATYIFAEGGEPFESAPGIHLIPPGIYAANDWSIRSHDAGSWRFTITDDAASDETCIGGVRISYCGNAECSTVTVVENPISDTQANESVSGGTNAKEEAKNEGRRFLR